MRQAKQCKFTLVAMERLVSNDKNLSHGEITSAERQSKCRKFQWTGNENMLGKDVKAASETNMFSGTCHLLLPLFPFAADLSMDMQKNTF